MPRTAMRGNAAHQAVSALRDEGGGGDRYSADWYAQGMGLDVAVGVLYDDAGGDVYGARGGSQGAATANSSACLQAERAVSARRGQAPAGAEPSGCGVAERRAPAARRRCALHSPASRLPRPADNPPIAVQAPVARTCPSSDPGESLLCRVRDAPDVEAIWRELALLANDALAVDRDRSWQAPAARGAG